MPITRRAVLAALVVVPLVGCTPTGSPSKTSKAPQPKPSSIERPPIDFAPRFEQLGVHVVDTGSERTVSFRADERFAYCSTFKVLAVGALLRQRTLDQFDAIVEYAEADLVAYSPITEQHLDRGMTLRELCDAAIRYSDNAAANLLLRELGGPGGLQGELATIGDLVTQVDRIEPELNTAVPGDPRDTSTPLALANDPRTLVLGDGLAADKQALLSDWLRQNTTGASLIRAGVPDDWTVGDKSGACSYGTRNDIGIAWPPGADPLIISILSARSTPDAAFDDALIAEAAALAVDALV